VLFGSIGLGYFLYGRKQHAVVTLLLVGIGVLLTAIPYFLRL
jgi:hypothetical protein